MGPDGPASGTSFSSQLTRLAAPLPKRRMIFAAASTAASGVYSPPLVPHSTFSGRLSPLLPGAL